MTAEKKLTDEIKLHSVLRTLEGSMNAALDDLDAAILRTLRASNMTDKDVTQLCQLPRTSPLLVERIDLIVERYIDKNKDY
jgi:hypothetical protein